MEVNNEKGEGPNLRLRGSYARS
ncbi:hypothetical protein BRAS3843_2900033 [Bradyrhizobium sp. STM 3843]|nr:hypothetical protein BRAS3843_2900033 [Bradyrhizobium sp. STM 3843]